MKERVRAFGGLFHASWKTIVLFEMLFRIFSAYALFPFCKWLFNSCLRITHIYYLTAENLLRFAMNPLMLACSLMIVALFTMASVLEAACLMTVIHVAKLGRMLGVLQLFQEGLRDAVRMLRPRNFPLLILTMLLLPVLQLPNSASPLRLIHLPWAPLIGYALKFPFLLLPLIYAAFVLFCYCLLASVYPTYVLENLTAMESFRVAFQRARAFWHWRLAMLVLVMSVSCLLVFGGTSILNRLLNSLMHWLVLPTGVQYQIRRPVTVVFSFLRNSVPYTCCYCFFMLCYYREKARYNEQIPPQVPCRSKGNPHRQNTIAFFSAIIVTMTALILSDTLLRPLLIRFSALDLISSRPLVVIAHRGSQEDHDENTLPAFQDAIAFGADYIELDVQQTSDGVVVVNHDKTFARVFGDPSRVWRITMDEASRLRSRRSQDAPPTLEEVLLNCDPNANFIVELKPNGHNPDLPKAAYDVIATADALPRCAIQSSSYSMLCAFKALSLDTRCGYILSFALGDYTHLGAADFFSIDYDFVDESVVHSIHRLGKSLYVWTVDDEKKVNRLLDYGADGIITDNVPLVKNVLLASSDSVLEELISAPIEEALEAADEFFEEAPELIQPLDDAVSSPGESN